MLEPRRIESNITPQKFADLGNGNWYYKYDVQSKVVEVPKMDGSGETVNETRWNYVQVRISGKPTLSKCYTAILKQYKNENGSSMYDSQTLGLDKNDLYDEILYAIKVDFGMETEMTPLEKIKKNLIKKVDEFDSSDEVNSFFLNGIKVWLDKDTRVGLMNSLTIEKNSGKEKSTLWFNNICITINCDAAIQMLSSLELYALSCYNVTAEHKVAIQNLTTLDEAMNYDFTAGYPEKLNFTI